MSSGRLSGSIVISPPIADRRHHSSSMLPINLIRNVLDRQFGRYLPADGGNEASSLQEGRKDRGLGASRSFSLANGHEASGPGGNPATARVPEGMKVHHPPGDAGAAEPVEVDL